MTVLARILFRIGKMVKRSKAIPSLNMRVRPRLEYLEDRVVPTNSWVYDVTNRKSGKSVSENRENRAGSPWELPPRAPTDPDVPN